MKKIMMYSFLFFSLTANAQDKVLNIYGWAGEIPTEVIHLFEKESGIAVNLSTFPNNEMLFAKLLAVKNTYYDVIMPSSYFVERMAKLNLLEQLDHSKLPNLKNIHAKFSNPTYDKNLDYSVPFIWGVTGIFYNQKYFAAGSIKKWSDLWNKRFDNKLMLLDDARENFSMALLSLGHSANDDKLTDIQAAYLRLKALLPNVKVFSSDTVVSIMIDEDATVGMAWNGDTFKASRENKNIRFIFPQEGFVIWVDNFSIPKNAPHKNAAYQFINFMLRPDVALHCALETSFSTANIKAFELLPAAIRDNPIAYPSDVILRKGEFQTNLNDASLAIYEKYWNKLKMGG